MNHRFVVPPIDGPPTGGTRFNAELIEALRRRGETVDVGAGDPPDGARQWVDTLYLDRVAAHAADAPVGLLTHYLPSLVSHGSRPPASQLRPDERAALHNADAFVVPSAFMAQELIALGVAPTAIGIVEPGVAASARPAPARPAATPGQPVRVLLVGNVTPGKGIAALIEALPPARGHWTLEVVGSLDMDPTYAARCRALVAKRDGDVTLAGAVTADMCLQRIGDVDLVVSASSMESYGMVLADAGACGTPIIARRGGNVDNMVTPHRGGELVADVDALARAVHALATDRDQLATRRRRARAEARWRTWDDAAEAFVSFAARIG